MKDSKGAIKVESAEAIESTEVNGTESAYDIDSINVGPRPLDIVFKEYPYLVVPKGISFSIIVTLWDVALKTIADPSRFDE